MKAAEIREKFLNYFKTHEHKPIESSSLIPQNDPTLLFANAGMNQFKDYFTGKSNPEFKRAVSIQKCVRAGGKHNDLENVGQTARHHTFFEMLGNFSFGDYFKKEAIHFAWDFLTKELSIPKDRLYVTVHFSDDEAANIWEKEIGVAKDRIFKKGDKDNFWEMGEYGPCGPCSEIFYDHGPEHSTPHFTPKEGQDILDDEMRYVEVWNLVFMQYEKTKDGTKSLPNPCVDTGAGLERLTAVMQGKYWNYDTDLFMPIINHLEKKTGANYSKTEDALSLRVIADHIRSTTMLITDGVLPSSEGRGYVLRRIIRRAVRHLRELNAKDLSFASLVDIVFELLGDSYPENLSNKELASKMLKIEEEKFLQTLDQGLKFLGQSIENDIQNQTLPGDIIFKLYDTYGFPADLTQIILQEKNLKADMDGFETAMAKRKEDSKQSWKAGEAIDLEVYYSVKEKFGETVFCGYETLEAYSTLHKVIDLGDDCVGLVFSETPFYAESGGQNGDIGAILNDSNEVIAEIIDTKKPIDNFHLHICKTTSALKEEQRYNLKVDETSRNLTARNHSATHLLQAALIEVVGDHIKQSGSQVGPEKLRFDFTHPQQLTKSELEQVEKLVNQKIRENLNVQVMKLAKDEAIQMGAMALFGEKYGNEVRVLKMEDFSTELCGGTHVSNTGEIEFFSILSEAALSAGVRRIEALSSTKALDRLSSRSKVLEKIEDLLKLKDEKTFELVGILLENLKKQQKEIQQLNDKIQDIGGKELFNQTVIINGIQTLTLFVEEGSDLRKLSDTFVSRYTNGLLFLATERKGKLAALVRRGKALESVACGPILNEVLKSFGGKGGGKPDMAQGSADLAPAEKVLEIAKKVIETHLG